MRSRLNQCLLLILAVTGLGNNATAQPVELDFRQYTTADGVPSSETYFTYEDTKGFLWVGTDNGIARFNGYEFEVFDDETGLEDEVVFSIQEATDGRIWVSSLSGQVFYFDHGRFHPYEYNAQLLQVKQSSELVYLLDVLSTGELIMKVEYQGIARLETDGEVTWLTNNDISRLYIYVPENASSGFPRQFRYYISAPERITATLVKEVLEWNGQEFVPAGIDVEQLPRLYPKRTILLDERSEGKGIILIDPYRLIRALPNGELLVFDISNSGVEHLMPMADGRYVISRRGGIGLTFITLDYSSETARSELFLEGRSIAMTRLDGSGGLWVNTLDAGVFYCPNPNQIVHVAQDDALGSRPVSLTVIDTNYLVVSYSSGSLLMHNLESGEQRKVNPGNNAGILFDDVFFDTLSRNLVWLNNFMNIAEDYSFDPASTDRLKTPVGKTPQAVKEFRQEDSTLYWTGTQGFGTIDPVKKTVTTRLPYYPNRKATHGLESYYRFPNGKEYVGTWYGMRRIKDSTSLEPDNLGIPELSGRITRILSLGGDTVAVGTRGRGLVIWWPDGHEVLTTENKLASNSVRNMHVDQRGVLWVATFEGLSKITRKPNRKGFAVRSFNQGNGLVDNEIHDVESCSGKLYLASTAGVYNFVEPVRDSISVPPMMTQVTVNGNALEVKEKLILKPQENYLSFEYSTIIFSMRGGVLYRYRLQTDDTDNTDHIDQPWQTTRARIANYPNLPAGAYRFEVQSQNQDGVWSRSTVQEVEIEQYWLYTWKALLAGGLLIFGAISIYFYFREQRRRREQNLLLEISRLEHSALHAQMNPHFVFNCLNSIQNFILHNDTLQAAKYLARFAHLIRKTLRSSVQGAHTLAEEYDMIKRYLELEKLRFKDVFDYTVEIDPEMDKANVFLPPLLVQPFAENAVLHGFKERASGGLVQVYFSGSSELIRVTVTDNGAGIDPNAPVKKDSMGMGITRRRLELLKSKKHPGLTLQVMPVNNPDGTVRGTRVTLLIQPVAEPPTTH